MAWDAGSIDSRLDVDTRPFHDGLEHAKAEAREFADKKYTATVDINTRRSQDELSAVESRLHSIESSMDRIASKGGGSGGGRGGLLSRFAGASIPNPSGMALGIGAALPLAAPFAALGGGVAGGALTAGATGLLGLGAFGAGAKASFGTVQKDVQNLTKLTKQYDAATTNKQRATVLGKEAALWKGLDPLQRQAVKNVQHLDASWESYKKKLEPQSFKVIADGAGIAETGLKYLLPTAKAVGGEIDLLLRRAERGFKSPFWHQFFGDFLPGEAARSVGALGTTLGHLGTGIGHLVEDFAPLAHILEDDSTGMAAKFEKWTEGSGPSKFVAWAEKNGPPAAKALEALAKALGGLAVGFAPLGGIELRLFTPVLTAIGDLSKAHPKTIEAVGGALLVVAGGLKAINLAQGAAGILSKIPGLGKGGGGGGLGGFAGSLTKPVPVYVTNWGGKPPIAGGSGPVATAERDAEHAAEGGAVTQAVRKAIEKAGLTGARKLGGPLALTYFATQGGDVAPGQHGPPLAQRNNPYAQLFALHGGKDFPGSDYANNRLDPSAAVRTIMTSGDAKQIAGLQALAKQYPIIAAAIKDVNAQQSVLNQFLVKNTGLGRANAAAAAISAGQIAVAHGRSVNSVIAQLKRVPLAYRQLAADAKAQGMTIGEYLNQGLADGITAREINAVEAAQHTIDKVMAVYRNRPQIASPSKVTTYYGKMIAKGLEVGFTGYQTQLEKAVGKSADGLLNALGTRVNNAANQYRADLQARADLRSSVAGGIMGEAALSNATLSNTGNATVGGFLAGQIRQDTTFDRLLKQLRKRGVDPRLIQQIADAGPQQGAMLAQQILAGGQAGIRRINAQERTLGKLADSIGGTVSGATFAGTLARDQRALDKVVVALEHLVSKKLDLSLATQHQFARILAQAIIRELPGIDKAALDKALGISVMKKAG